MAGETVNVGDMLNKQLFVILTTTVVDRETMLPLLQDHLRSQIALEKAGIMFAAGPFSGEDEKPTGGMFIVRAGSFDEARKIADADPLHAAGYRRYTLHRWSMNEGSFNVKLRYSDQTFHIE